MKLQARLVFLEIRLYTNYSFHSGMHMESHSNSKKGDFFNQTKSAGLTSALYMPQITYILGVLGQNDNKCHNYLHQNGISDNLLILLWNEIDAVCTLIIVIDLLTKKDHHRQANITRALLLMSGACLMSIATWKDTATYGAPTFACAGAIDLLIALERFQKAWNQRSFVGWLEEQASEVAYINNQLKIDPHNFSLKKRRHEYLVNMKLRYKVNNWAGKLDKDVTKINTLMQNSGFEITRVNGIPSSLEVITENIMQDNLNNAFYDSLVNVCVCTLSFTGMALTCSTGIGSLAIGSALVKIAMGYYIANLSIKITNITYNTITGETARATPFSLVKNSFFRMQKGVCAGALSNDNAAVPCSP